METRRGPKRREGRAEERQETREQRPEVKGEGGGERPEGREGPGVLKERKGHREEPVEGRGVDQRGVRGRQGSWNGAFKSVLQPGNCAGRGKEAVPGKQENRGRGSLSN